MPQLTLAAVDGAIVVDAATFTFSGIPVEQQRPSRFELSKGSLAMADVSWLVANNPLVFGGSIGVAAEDPPLNLSLKGLVDLRVLSAFTSAVGFDGNANINTLIEGTFAKPLLDGQIMLDGAEIAISDPRVVLSELNGPIVLDGQRAVFDGVRGLANGGALALDGSLEFEALALSGGSLNIQAQGVALELPKGLRSELDALVTFRPDPRNPSLTGDIRVVQSAYTETITIAALARQAALPVGVGGGNAAVAVSRSPAAQSRVDDHRRHHRRQQLRPPVGRGRSAAGRYAWPSPGSMAASPCARADRSLSPAGRSG